MWMLLATFVLAVWLLAVPRSEWARGLAIAHPVDLKAELPQARAQPVAERKAAMQPRIDRMRVRVEV